MNTNVKQVGWMYHSVPLKRKAQSAHIPPISQIPNIGRMPDEFYKDNTKHMVFKSTDTPFIRLSKMGGRCNLLTFKENEYNKGDAMRYPRCDWFYLEDNALEDHNPNEKAIIHEFGVPAYMSHNTTIRKQFNSKPVTEPIVTSAPPPLPQKSKGKVVNMYSEKRPGYAEYNKKLNKVGIARRIYDLPKPIIFPKKDISTEKNVDFRRLVAHGYANEYDIYRKQWDEITAFMKDKPCCDEKGLVPLNNMNKKHDSKNKKKNLQNMAI